jgi:hypothetical protein
MKLLSILFILLLLMPGCASLACPNETVTIGRPYHVQTIKGTIEPPDGSSYDELPITFTVKQRGAEKTWVVPVHGNGDFLLVVPKGVYDFTIRVEGFLFTIVGTFLVGDEGETEPIAIRPPWC